MRIPKWEKFQHYKHRKPPWIRLYRELLEDPAWVHQSDAAKALLCELWMVASDTQDGSLPAIEALAWRLRRSEADIRLALAAISPKFLDGASGALADCKQDATSEERRVTEQRRAEPQRYIEPPMPIPPGIRDDTDIDRLNAVWSQKRGGDHRYIGECLSVVRAIGLGKAVAALERYLDAKESEKFKGSPSDFAANYRMYISAPPSGPRHRTIAELKALEGL